MTTPWEKADAQRKARRQEDRMGKKPGAQKQVNSGRTWFSKRDVRWNGFLVETRYTDNKTYPIERDEFKRMTSDAIRTPPGQLPAMQIDFGEPTSTLSLFVMRLQDHEAREAYIAELEERLRGTPSE